MVFSSNIFLFAFLPLFLATYYLAPRRARNAVVALGSIAFYGWWRLDFLALILAITFANFVFGQRIGRHEPRSPSAKRWVTAAVVSNLAVLGYFKYANFGVDSFNALMVSMGSEPVLWAHVLLPIGISFHVFQSISYVVDVYRGDTPHTNSLMDFSAYSLLFPQLIAGPVLRYKDLAPQFADRTHTLDKFSEGTTRFMLGFIKKVVIADSIAPLANGALALENPSAADAWFGTLASYLQVYFDFSGYSDMAIGLGLMMGFRLVENFDRPLLCQSITEFWSRWHLSLSAWLRDYVYISLGGNRGGSAMQYRNIFLTMLLGGFWHGASWNFVFWGAWYGAAQCVEKKVGIKARPGTFRLHRWIYGFGLVTVAHVLFYSGDLEHAGRLYKAMFSFEGFTFSDAYRSAITPLQITMFAVSAAIIVVEGWREYGPRRRPVNLPWKPATAIVVLGPLFVLAVLRLSAESYSPFLYFQF